MALRWVAKNCSPIAVDIGTDSIKLIQLTTEETPRLLAAASAPLPEEVRNSAEARNDFYLNALKDLIKRGGFKGNRVVLAIPTGLTHIQHVRLGKSDENQDSQIEIELRKRIDVDPSRLVIRTIPVGEVFAEGSAKQEIICVATGCQTVHRLMELATKAKLQVVGLHSEVPAIVQAFAHLYRREQDHNRTTMFIDIGAGTTKALITHGTDLVFAKMIQVAGRDLAVDTNEASEDVLGLDETDVPPTAEVVAEAVEPGLGGDERRSGGEGGGLAMLDAAVQADGPAQAATAAAAVAAPAPAPVSANSEMLDCLVDELHLCVGYHHSMFGDRSIEKVVFLGGSASNRAMCQHIARAMKLPAQLGDPLARLTRAANAAPPIGVDLRQGQPGWAVPVGLCGLPTNL